MATISKPKASTTKRTTKAAPKAKAKATTVRKSSTKAKATKASAPRVTGAKRTALAKAVVTMRTKQSKSWAQIATAKGVAPRTARRLFDEVKGEGAHHGLLAGKGGRTVQ
jgi:hypothetical protein